MIKGPCAQDLNLNVQNVARGSKNLSIGQVKSLILIKSMV